MRPPPRSGLAAAPRPAKLVLGGDLTLGPLSAMSPHTEAELLGLSGVFDELTGEGGWLVTPGKAGVPQSFGRLGAQPAAAAEGVALRCIDGTHAAGCTLCTPAPSAGEEVAYELTGEVGKKNGEKRLRSQLSRTPEWGSLDERTRVAQLCEAAGPTQARLAAALRARHCAELRKSDLMYLSRIWGYRSDVWSRRKDRRYAPRDGGAPPPPPPAVLPAAAATLLPRAPALAAGACKCAEPPALDSLVREPAAKQVAAVQAEIAGPLRQLAERSIDAFSTEAGPSEMLLIMSSRGGTMPAAVLAIAATAMSHSSSHLQMAQAGLKRLLDGARQVHAELQLTLLRLTPAEGARPAFSAFAGKEAPWDVLLREVLLLSDFAIVCSTALEAVPAAAAAQQSSSTTDGGSGGDDEAVQLMISSCKKAHVALGGQLCMELVTRVCSMLAQLKLASTAVYLNAVSLSVGLLIGHMSAVQQALEGQAERMQCAQNVLKEAGIVPPTSPTSLVVQEAGN